MTETMIYKRLDLIINPEFARFASNSMVITFLGRHPERLASSEMCNFDNDHKRR